MARSVFLDIDGVLTDHRLIHDDFSARMGEVLAPALGGTVEEWGRANAATFPQLFAESQRLGRPDETPAEVWEFEYRMSMHLMCDWLGRPRLSDEEAARLGRDYTVHVRRNTGALFAGAEAMTRSLAARHELHLATGNPSWVADALLKRIGVRELIGFPCGPDLIGVSKRSDRFHSTLFEAVGVPASDAVVVDDDVRQLIHARAAGAATVLVTLEPVEEGVADAVVSDPSEVPDVIRALDG